MKNPFDENLISIHILSFLNAKDALQFGLTKKSNYQHFKIALRESLISNQILTKAIYRNRFQPSTYAKIIQYSNSHHTLSYKLLPYGIYHGSAYPILNKWELFFTPTIHFHPFVLSIHTSYSHFQTNWHKMSKSDLQYRRHITFSYMFLWFLYHISIFIFYTFQFIGLIGLFILFMVLSFQSFSKETVIDPIIIHFHPNLSYIDNAYSQRLLAPGPLGHVHEQFCSLPFPYVI